MPHSWAAQVCARSLRRWPASAPCRRRARSSFESTSGRSGRRVLLAPVGEGAVAIGVRVPNQACATAVPSMRSRSCARWSAARRPSGRPGRRSGRPGRAAPSVRGAQTALGLQVAQVVADQRSRPAPAPAVARRRRSQARSSLLARRAVLAGRRRTDAVQRGRRPAGGRRRRPAPAVGRRRGDAASSSRDAVGGSAPGPTGPSQFAALPARRRSGMRARAAVQPDDAVPPPTAAASTQARPKPSRCPAGRPWRLHLLAQRLLARRDRARHAGAALGHRRGVAHRHASSRCPRASRYRPRNTGPRCRRRRVHRKLTSIRSPYSCTAIWPIADGCAGSWVHCAQGLLARGRHAGRRRRCGSRSRRRRMRPMASASWRWTASNQSFSSLVKIRTLRVGTGPPRPPVGGLAGRHGAADRLPAGPGKSGIVSYASTRKMGKKRARRQRRAGRPHLFTG